MSETDLPAREAMEFDVVVVGAGPAGLSAAIRLKQLNPELGVVVVEKGSEVGAHILSGAVIDPIGLDRLLPEWRSEDTPIKTPVTDDRFYWLGPAGSVRVPNFLLPPLMSNHGAFIVSLGNVCRWLATKAEALGVEIYPGFAAAEVLYGERGEVVIQGPNVVSGYENNPDANAKSFTNGWFRTGDQGFLDAEGYLTLTGRLKELINRGGEKIGPREIDEVLLSHPAVAEAVCFGVPHPSWGEEVAAAVVLTEPVSEAEILAFCKERLAEFKRPKKIYVTSAIPRTATGKIQRGNVAKAFVEA